MSIVGSIPLVLVGTARGTFPGTNAEIAFAASGDIWVVNADGSGLQQLIASPRIDRHPAWSPDGSTLAFTRIRENGNADIYLADADGGNVRRFTDSRNDDIQPAWSPSGDAIVFVRAYTAVPRKGTDLVASSLDGQDHNRITRNTWVESAPAWRDGYIAWVSGRIHEVCASPLSDMNDDIRICQVLGNGYRRTSLSFEPGSRLLAFGARIDFGNEFDIVAARFGQDDDNLTSGDGYPVDHSPTWSPDGTQIAFVGRQEGESVLALMSATGTGIHEILTAADVEGISWPSWRSVP